MTPSAPSDRLMDLALARHFAPPQEDLAPRVSAAFGLGVRASLAPDEVERLIAPHTPARRPRPLVPFALGAAAVLAAVVAARLWPRSTAQKPRPVDPAVTAADEARFEALVDALFVPGGHAPVVDPFQVPRELTELERLLRAEPRRWTRFAEALLQPDLRGTAVAPLDFLHMLPMPEALGLARELWRREPAAFSDLHLASFAELGDPVFRAELVPLVERGASEPCEAPVFAAAYLALDGDGRGVGLLRRALLEPCPDDPARALAANLALEHLGDVDTGDLWLALVKSSAASHLARGDVLRAVEWLEAHGALRAWRSPGAERRLARLHLTLIQRLERRLARPLDAAAVAAELAALVR